MNVFKMTSMTFLVLLSLFAPCANALECGDPDSCIAIWVNIFEPMACSYPGAPGILGFYERDNLVGLDSSCSPISFDGYIEHVPCYPLSLIYIHYYKYYWDGTSWKIVSHFLNHFPSNKPLQLPAGAYVTHLTPSSGWEFITKFPNGCSDLQMNLIHRPKNIGPPPCLQEQAR